MTLVRSWMNDCLIEARPAETFETSGTR